jgi:hypothetical protein
MISHAITFLSVDETFRICQDKAFFRAGSNRWSAPHPVKLVEQRYIYSRY